MRMFAVTVDGSGRILLPAGVRKQLNLRRGSELIGQLDKERLLLKTRTQALKEAQEHFSRLRPAGKMWSDELIEERRREARREKGR